MTLDQTDNDVALFAVPPEQTRGSWLRVARGAWIVLALVLLIYFVASIPLVFQTLQTVCTKSDPSQCPSGELSPDNVRALAQLQLAIPTYVGLLVGSGVALSLMFWTVAALIFWRKSEEWIGLSYSVLLGLFAAGGGLGPLAIAVDTQTALPLRILATVSSVLSSVQWASLATILLTFPTGRFTPRWSALLVAIAVLVNLLPPTSNQAVAAVEAFSAPLAYGGMVGIQIYRYVRVFDPVQRQQTKWFVYAFALAVGLLSLNSLPALVVPSLGAADSWYQLIPFPIFALMLLPLSVGVAILRYRLWDIDVLINRTLVYTSLTALLAGLYICLIVTAQALVRVLTGSLTQQPLVLVASTLAIAALVQPLRRRLQATIDGRFYRRKYDAAQVVAAFSSTLRQEVDLDQLREQLAAVVQETMQPTRVLVWLRPTDQDRSRSKVYQSRFDGDRNLTPSAAAATRVHRPTTP